jgi:hypothetical protein
MHILISGSATAGCDAAGGIITLTTSLDNGRLVQTRIHFRTLTVQNEKVEGSELPNTDVPGNGPRWGRSGLDLRPAGTSIVG